ncbi:MAG: DNA polymerase IV [Gammaproteobacteria bacterium]|nr:DNA polymerase IV [Gammaproteobacteria bacterium]
MAERVSRKIIHIDMDCFYAAIEIRDNPSLQGKPVAIGRPPQQRGVLATCNYEARKYGLHSAMSSAQALKQCPQLILLPGNMERYRQVSQQIQQIFHQYSEIVEPIALDEAFLDVSDSSHCHGSATWIAQAIRHQVSQQCQITASAGVAANKFLAKIASDWNKPNGQFVIPPEQVNEFIVTLPVKSIVGVGRVTADKLRSLGITTCADLQKWSRSELLRRFGKFGERLYRFCRGDDDRAVEPQRIRQSLSIETTYADNLVDLNACLAQLGSLLSRLIQRLTRCEQRPIEKQYIKIKFHDFSHTTVECLSTDMNRTVYEKLLTTGFARGNKAVRLLGIGVRFSTPVEQQASAQYRFDW